MGGNGSTCKPDTERQGTLSTAAPTTSPAPCLSNHHNKKHLILAFCAGVLLTLLLIAFIFLIIKSYRKYRRERLPISPGPLLRWVPLLSGTMADHTKPQAPDPHSDPPAKLSSIPGESLTYASTTFKLSEEKSNHLAENHSADFDPIVYAQIKVTN
ncbi:transmembrane protein C1orf162 homolog isoform X1 [Pan paniscus]|uniref:Chromosome 1 open reading frame 162 n=1 Tax=Pan paniscus TaxID=9597 RepID=A0A2R9BGH6_PANPA|nr:transmembrane protein C1orf162 homolog isoform X1 [Pan paniscus]